MTKSVDQLRWIATFFGITGGLLIASNADVSRYAFMIFMVSSVLWGVAAYKIRDYALLVLQAVFLLIDTHWHYSLGYFITVQRLL